MAKRVSEIYGVFSVVIIFEIQDDFRKIEDIKVKNDINKAYYVYELIKEMKSAGIEVITKVEVEERFAVIDDELVWHGG